MFPGGRAIRQAHGSAGREVIELKLSVIVNAGANLDAGELAMTIQDRLNNDPHGVIEDIMMNNDNVEHVDIKVVPITKTGGRVPRPNKPEDRPAIKPGTGGGMYQHGSVL